jgi:hypothetical protein
MINQLNVKQGPFDSALIFPGKGSPTRNSACKGPIDLPRRPLCGFRVFPEACHIDEHAALVADNPGIVSGWHVESVPGAEFHFRAVIHPDDHAPFYDVTGVPRA